MGQVEFAAVPMSTHVSASAAAVVPVNEASASTVAAAMKAFTITATSNIHSAYLRELASLAAICTTVAIQQLIRSTFWHITVISAVR